MNFDHTVGVKHREEEEGGLKSPATLSIKTLQHIFPRHLDISMPTQKLFTLISLFDQFQQVYGNCMRIRTDLEARLPKKLLFLVVLISINTVKLVSRDSPTKYEESN